MKNAKPITIVVAVLVLLAGLAIYGYTMSRSSSSTSVTSSTSSTLTVYNTYTVSAGQAKSLSLMIPSSLVTSVHNVTIVIESGLAILPPSDLFTNATVKTLCYVRLGISKCVLFQSALPQITSDSGTSIRIVFAGMNLAISGGEQLNIPFFVQPDTGGTFQVKFQVNGAYTITDTVLAP